MNAVCGEGGGGPAQPVPQVVGMHCQRDHGMGNTKSSAQRRSAWPQELSPTLGDGRGQAAGSRVFDQSILQAAKQGERGIEKLTECALGLEIIVQLRS